MFKSRVGSKGWKALLLASLLGVLVVACADSPESQDAEQDESEVATPGDASEAAPTDFDPGGTSCADAKPANITCTGGIYSDKCAAGTSRWCACPTAHGHQTWSTVCPSDPIYD
jgi:hypothetical protein